jgi:hypothetical protein
MIKIEAYQCEYCTKHRKGTGKPIWRGKEIYEWAPGKPTLSRVGGGHPRRHHHMGQASGM